MPKGHLPVRSYLAVPVKSRSGEVIGGLFFGHSQTGVFTERAERLVCGVAAQAGIAIDNARLYEAAQRAADERTALLESERAARSAAERLSDVKDEFLATLSHELRTPLNAIVGWTTILRQDHLPSSIVAEGVATIERNAKMQSQLIEDLLDVSRILTGKLRLDAQPVDLAPIVETAIASVYPASVAKNIRLTREITTEGTMLLGDAGRLQQVVWNLLSNAVKFTPAGGRVTVSLMRQDADLSLVIEDTGKGIAPHFLPHVFDRFRQADASTTRPHAGLGLGLAIVRHLIEQHGGTVEAFSDGEGCGSRFVVTLPIAAADIRESTASSPRAPLHDAAHPLPDLQGVRVLVVDDESDSRVLLQRLFEQRRAAVETSHSVADAIEKLSRAPFDVVISDIGMPEQDGYDLVQQLRALPSGASTPAIALTAFARAEDRRRALRAGFHLHIAKPVDPAELLTAVAVISRRGR
jgi:signal transduction histidine kinase